MQTSLTSIIPSLCAFVAISTLLLDVTPASAQTVRLARIRLSVPGYVVRRNPVDVISSRVYAHADLVRAGGQAAVSHSVARILRAKAVREELINEIKRVETFYEKRALIEAERIKATEQRLDGLKRRNSRTWDRLKNHEELNGPAIVSGEGLNFLLHRLSGSVLAYKFSLGHDADHARFASLKLTPEMLSGLNLRQSVGNGEQLVFRADEGVALNVEWWPPLLREDVYAPARKKFEGARERLIDESQRGPVGQQTLTDLQKSLTALSELFEAQSTRDKRLQKGFRSWKPYSTARAFLTSLNGEMDRLQTVGPGEGSAFGGNLRFTGNDLVALLTYMSRNGLDFAPATPGHESAYHGTFRMMRDLYITAADDDESTQHGKTAPARKAR